MPRRWFVHHTDIEHNFYPGQEVVAASPVMWIYLKDEPRSTPNSVNILRAMCEKKGVVKLHSVWVEHDGQMMTTIRTNVGTAFIPAQYLRPLKAQSEEEVVDDMERMIEGLADAIKGSANEER